MAYNKVILEGRLTSDPDLRTTTSGVAVCNFSLAVDRNFKNGEERLADFPTLRAWRGTAGFIAKYFRKGDPILIDGRLETSKYQDKDGKTIYRTDVVVENATFTLNKPKSESQEEKQYAADEKNYENELGENQSQNFTEVSDGDENDLPF